MGEYYYIELKYGHTTLPILHRTECIRANLSRKDIVFLGTFYRPADALLIAKKRFRKCTYCPQCF